MCLRLQSFAFLNCLIWLWFSRPWVITVNRLCAGRMTISRKISKNAPGLETWPGCNSQQTLQRVRRGRSCFGGIGSLKSWLVRDCDGHAVGFLKYFCWNNYGLVLNPRKSGAVEKRAQAEASVASPTAASPDAEPEAAAIGNAMRTHTHAASLRKHRKWGSPGSNAIFRWKSYIRAFFAYWR